MKQVAILEEFKQLSLPQQLEVLASAVAIVQEKVQQAKQQKRVGNQKQQLGEAAQALLSDYQEDEELTAFTVLDGALIREVGVTDTARFLHQFGAGYGDYTAERAALFGHLSLDEVIEQSRRYGREENA